MDRRHYLAGTGSMLAIGAAGCTDFANQDDESSENGATEDDGGRDGDDRESGVRTLLHLSSDDPSDRGSALNNAENLLADSTVENEEVRIVANSGGIFAFVEGESQHADQVRSLLDEGVVIVVCENTLEGTGTPESALVDGVDTVPAGVGELAKRQAEGYGYIKVP